MSARAGELKRWIDSRRSRDEITPCVFSITVPKIADLWNDPTIKKVEALLDKYNISHQHVDTNPGSWNLNRDWVETRRIDCIVEYCGVYPINWDLEDVVELERMDTEGEIIINVSWVTEDGYVPNH